MVEPLVGVQDSLRISYGSFLKGAEESRQRAIALARLYHEGEHGGELTHRLKEFIKSAADGHAFSMNVCRSVVMALTERLCVTGFDSSDAKLIAWAEKVWADNVLTAVQDDTYEWALRDGEAFMILGWDEDEVRPRFTLHERFTDLAIEGGDGYGCFMTYTQDDPNQKALSGTKIWSELMPDKSGRKVLTQRKTEYYPDRIQKYVMGEQGKWDQYSDEGDEGWPIPWLAKDGKPLGIPMIHFKNKGLRCEAWDAFPLQDAVNKELIDLLMAGDATAFRIFVALGFIPTSDGKQPADDRSNWQRIEPGEVVATTKPASEASFDAIDGADLEPLQNLVHQLVMWLAMVTETPITRYTTTKLIASDETLKEQENPLLSRVSVRQVLFGTAWTNCLKMARKMENLWGAGGMDETIEIKVQWREAQVRGDTEKLTNLGLKKNLGIPQEQLWKEAGYDQATIIIMQSQAQKEQASNDQGTGNGTGPGAPSGRPGVGGSNRNGGGRGNGNGASTETQGRQRTT